MNDILKILHELACGYCLEDYTDQELHESVYDYAGSNIDDAYRAGRKSGQILLARELLKKHDKRSDPQNKIFHVWMIEISKAWNFHKLENEPMISPEGFKEFFKRLFLGCEDLHLPDCVLRKPKKTSKLTKSEFATLLDDIQNYVRSEMSDYGINLERGA